MFHAFRKRLKVGRVLRDKNDVRTAVTGSERNIARVSPHDFDNGNPAVAFSGRADAFDTAGRDENCGSEAGSCVINDLFEIKDRIRFSSFIPIALLARAVIDADPLVGLTG